MEKIFVLSLAFAIILAGCDAREDVRTPEEKVSKQVLSEESYQRSVDQVLNEIQSCMQSSVSLKSSFPKSYAL